MDQSRMLVGGIANYSEKITLQACLEIAEVPTGIADKRGAVHSLTQTVESRVAPTPAFFWQPTRQLLMELNVELWN